MRFKLRLKVEKGQYGDLLPLNYSYPFSSWLYKVLANSDSAYATWLHDNGFQFGGKRFKFFTFSRLMVDRYEISNDRIVLKSDHVELYISFLPEKSTEEFIKGIFSEQEFRIGDLKSRVAFRVEQVELMPPVDYQSEREFVTLSPMVVSVRENSGKITYLSPDTPDIEKLVLANLLNRYQAYYGKEFPETPDLGFKLLSKPKPVLITIKADTPEQSKIKGYNCRFHLKAPEELLKIAYEAGIGEKGSLGFGMIAEK